MANTRTRFKITITANSPQTIRNLLGGIGTSGDVKLTVYGSHEGKCTSLSRNSTPGNLKSQLDEALGTKPPETAAQKRLRKIIDSPLNP